MIDSKTHSEEMALLGQKQALLKVLNNVNTEINKIDSELKHIEHKRTISLIKGEKVEYSKDK